MSNTTMNLSSNRTENYQTTSLPETLITYENLIKGIIPTIIFLVILSVIGTIGNIHVLIVFVFKIKTKSTYITYVASLAFIDCLVSTVFMPLEIMDLKYPDTFWSPITCRLFRFNHTFLTSLSALVLLVLAIDRYKRICRTLKNQWSVTSSRKLVGLCIVVAAILNLPSFLVFGMRTTPIDRNTTVQTCFINDAYKNSYFTLAWIGLICLLCLIIVFLLIFTYVSIGCYIRKKSFDSVNHTKRFYSVKDVIETSKIMKINTIVDNGNQRQIEHRKISCESTITGISLYENQEEQDPEKVTDDNRIDEKRKKTMRNSGSSISKHFHVSSKPTKSSTYFNLKRFPSANSKETNKVTKITCVITIMFIICNLSYVAFAIIFGLIPDFKLHLGETELILYRLAIRLVFVNNVCNPFIYGVFDNRFIKITKQMYKRFSLCKT